MPDELCIFCTVQSLRLCFLLIHTQFDALEVFLHLMWSCSLLIMHTLCHNLTKCLFYVNLFEISMKLPHRTRFIKCSSVHYWLSSEFWEVAVCVLKLIKGSPRMAQKPSPDTVRRKLYPLLARGSSSQYWVVCSSSLGRLLTGTWQQWNINKFPVVGWQAGRCGSPATIHAQLGSGGPTLVWNLTL